jgi:hypothetical protein
VLAQHFRAQRGRLGQMQQEAVFPNCENAKRNKVAPAGRLSVTIQRLARRP